VREIAATSAIVRHHFRTSTLRKLGATGIFTGGECTGIHSSA
jgi:hypothetical protein